MNTCGRCEVIKHLKAYGLIQRGFEDFDLTYEVRHLIGAALKDADDAFQGFDLLP